MEIKRYSEFEDFPHILLWHNARNIEPPHPDFLPRCGVMIRQDGRPLCAGFIFFSDAQLATMGNAISDPKISFSLRNEAFELLIDALMEIARQAGARFVTAGSTNPRVIARLSARGFVVKEKGLTMLMKGVQ